MPAKLVHAQGVALEIAFDAISLDLETIWSDLDGHLAFFLRGKHVGNAQTAGEAGDILRGLMADPAQLTVSSRTLASFP